MAKDSAGRNTRSGLLRLDAKATNTNAGYETTDQISVKMATWLWCPPPSPDIPAPMRAIGHGKSNMNHRVSMDFTHPSSGGRSKVENIGLEYQ